MAKRKTDMPQLVRHDGALCATFVNSASVQRKPFSTYLDLLEWGQRCGALNASDAGRLENAAAERPEAAEAATRQAQELRTRLARILGALAGRATPAAADIAELNHRLAAALAHRRLVPAAQGYRWDWAAPGEDDLDAVLWNVLLSAAEVLSTKVHRRVSVCAGEDCDLILVDRSPGSPRKWCRICGPRSRSRKHYHKTVKPRRERMLRRLALSAAQKRSQQLPSHREHQPAQSGESGESDALQDGDPQRNS